MGRAERDGIDPTVWQQPEMRAALAARDVAAIYRGLQRIGISQRRIAALTGQSQSEVSEILSGRRVTAYEVLARIADGLGAPRGWMGLSYDEVTASALQQAGTDGVSGGVDDVRRRTLLAMGAAAVVSPLEAAATSGPQSVRPLVTGIVGRVSAAMLPAGTAHEDREPLPVAALADGVKQAWALRQQAQYEALGKLLATIIPDVERATRPGAPEEQQALPLAVHTYNTASSLLKKLGDGQLALVAADRAVRAAKTLDDPLLVATALYRLVNVLLPARRLADARRVALEAASTIEPGRMQTARSLAVCGGLLLTAAVAAARHGDESAAWLILGEARAAGRLLGADHADMYAIFGPTNVAIHAVQVAVGLGDGAGAVQRGQTIRVDRLPESLRERRAQFLIDLTHGHVLQRAHGEAVATLLRAERIAPEEVRLSGEVRGLVSGMLSAKPATTTELRQLAVRVGVGS